MEPHTLGTGGALGGQLNIKATEVKVRVGFAEHRKETPVACEDPLTGRQMSWVAMHRDRLAA